jgi:hypothetical protein
MKVPRLRRPGMAAMPALLALFLGSLATVALASSHREAPAISVDPQADNTDLYAFRDPNYPNNVVIIANWIPMEEPAGGPNFWHFGENIRYEINVDNDGDGVEDVTYRFLFTRHVRRGDTYTYNDGPIEGVDAKAWGSDPNLIVYYTYSVDKIVGKSIRQPARAAEQRRAEVVSGQL